MLRKSVGLVFFAVLAVSPAGAQSLPPVGQMDRHVPPVKKTPDGVCHAPGNSIYKQIRDFIPFVAMNDCLKSGGHPPPAKKP